MSQSNKLYCQKCKCEIRCSAKNVMTLVSSSKGTHYTDIYYCHNCDIPHCQDDCLTEEQVKESKEEVLYPYRMKLFVKREEISKQQQTANCGNALNIAFHQGINEGITFAIFEYDKNFPPQKQPTPSFCFQEGCKPASNNASSEPTLTINPDSLTKESHKVDNPNDLPRWSWEDTDKYVIVCGDCRKNPCVCEHVKKSEKTIDEHTDMYKLTNSCGKHNNHGFKGNCPDCEKEECEHDKPNIELRCYECGMSFKVCTCHEGEIACEHEPTLFCRRCGMQNKDQCQCGSIGFVPDWGCKKCGDDLPEGYQIKSQSQIAIEKVIEALGSIQFNKHVLDDKLYYRGLACTFENIIEKLKELNK